ncbi:MAG: acetyl-CoA hydrolase/transferase family protein [Eubacterium sp.]|jgi:4-hydroxybutyrate CoA-transferase
MNTAEKTQTNKICSPEEAVKLIHSHDRVFIGLISNTTPLLNRALWKRGNELSDITLISGMSLDPSPLLTKTCENDPFSLLSMYLGPYERQAIQLKKTHGYTSVHLSEIDKWFAEIGKITVAFLAVSAPDESGMMSFGPSGGSIYRYILETADRVILEINPDMPYVYGSDTLIAAEEADAIVVSNGRMPQIPDIPPSPAMEKISEYINPMVEDGSTIQLGIGGLSTAIGNSLTSKNDLGIFSEMFCSSMMLLMKNGNVTNRSKGFMNGKSVFAFAAGPGELYDFMDHNELLYNVPFPYANDPRNIMKNNRMISINTALALNIYGETAADALGYKQYSAIGGQLDYVRGSQWSKGGKSIIALESSYIKNGKRHSKINFNFPEGTPISTPRSDIEYVVTEYGYANLRDLTIADRARAIIELAHPDFRDELRDKAKHSGIF